MQVQVNEHGHRLLKNAHYGYSTSKLEYVAMVNNVQTRLSEASKTNLNSGSDLTDRNQGSIPGFSDRLQALPDLQQRLFPDSQDSVSTSDALVGYQSPLDLFLARNATDVGANTSAVQFSGNQISTEAVELGIGNQGPQVEQLQQRLNELGYDLGRADGDFGPRTALALNNYQQDRIESIENTLSNGPPPSARSVLNSQVAQLKNEMDRGVAGAMTQDQLNLNLAGTQEPGTVDPQPNVDPVDTDSAEVVPSGLGVGASGTDVRALQRDLQRVGYSPGTPDSQFGPATLAAVQDFQQDKIADLERLINTPGLPSYAGGAIVAARNSLQAEFDAEVFGAATAQHLERAVLDTIPGDLPVNRNLQVGSDGFVINDPNIVRNQVPQLEQGAFNDPVADIEHVVLHRTVTDTADQALTSFATPREGVHYGTHFLVGRDGTIQQPASLDQMTYHAAGHNSETVGIEVVGNPLDANGDVTVGYPDGNPVVSWEPLTQEQTEAVAYLTNTLNEYYGLGTDSTEIHEDINAKTEGEGGTVFDAIQPFLIP